MVTVFTVSENFRSWNLAQRYVFFYWSEVDLPVAILLVKTDPLFPGS